MVGAKRQVVNQGKRRLNHVKHVAVMAADKLRLVTTNDAWVEFTQVP